MKPVCKGTDGEGNVVLPCDKDLTEAMDIFSAGCVIAEMFLDGEPLFDLTQLLQYRVLGEAAARNAVGTTGGVRSLPPNDPEPQRLPKITDPRVQEFVRHMTQYDPADRCSASEYLIAHEVLCESCVSPA